MRDPVTLVRQHSWLCMAAGPTAQVCADLPAASGPPPVGPLRLHCPPCVGPDLVCAYTCAYTHTHLHWLCTTLRIGTAGALLSLCLLAQLYGHACDLIAELAALPLGAEVLVQVDRLVQLLETPAFAALRLQLLAPAQHPDLLRALYSLLMLLPQSSAFKTLAARLAAVPAATLMQLEAVATSPAGRGGAAVSVSALPLMAAGPPKWADWDALLRDFVQRQEQHAADEERRRLLLEGVRGDDTCGRGVMGAVSASEPVLAGSEAAAAVSQPEDGPSLSQELKKEQQLPQQQQLAAG